MAKVSLSFVYPITGTAAELLNATAGFTDLARRVRGNLYDLLRAGRPLDEATGKEVYSTLLFLDVLEGRRDDALSNITRLRRLSTKDSVRWTAHIVAECIVLSRPHERERITSFKTHLAERLDGLPWHIVGAEIRRLRADVEILDVPLLDGLVQTTCSGAHVCDEPLSHDLAAFIIRMRYYRTAVIPFREELKAILDRAIDARDRPQDCVWATRSENLADDLDLRPVVVGIWDGGLDVELFGARMARSGGKHSLAWDRHAQPSRDPLLPLSSEQHRDYIQLIDLVRGFGETRVGTRSAYAERFERRLTTLDAAGVTPFLEELEMIADHLHGTHVAGVAIAGNPFVELLSVRVTWEHQFAVDAAISHARLKAQIELYRVSIGFFQQGHARVVNISWNRSPSIYARHLSSSDIDEAHARHMFEEDRDALYAAMAHADTMLFVVAAGNMDENVVSSELFPASFDLPNVLVAGAADSAGSVASFSNRGAPSMVYALGCNVVAPVPGGTQIPLSGTSVAAAQVTNLAAKLLALQPSLHPPDVVNSIKQGADRDPQGNLFINPKNTIAIMKGSPASSSIS